MHTKRVFVIYCLVLSVSVLACDSTGSSGSPADGGGGTISDKNTSESNSSGQSSDEQGGLDNEIGDIEVTDDVDAGGWTAGDTQTTVTVSEDAIEVVEADGTVTMCYETICDGRLLECGDCVDNDGDGRADARDRECLGPCDNTEGPALISGVGGVTGSTCHVDCYFDYGNGIGSGSDDCWWDHQCDPLEPEKEVCPFDEKAARNQKFCPDEQSERCGEVCLPFTPNGCDCFGCCTFPELTGLGPDGGDGYVWIGAKDSSNNGTCTFDDVMDEAKCPRCTPIPNCLNDCGRCELCIGKTELPADCYSTPDGDVPETEQCPDGSVPCGLPDQPQCEQGYFCISGCCKPTAPVI